MKKLIPALLTLALCTACEQRIETPPGGADKETTIVNPPAGGGKSETNTTVVNPPAMEKKETNTTVVNPPASTETKTESTTTTTD